MGILTPAVQMATRVRTGGGFTSTPAAVVTNLAAIFLHQSFETGALGANISTISSASSANSIISADRALFGTRSARDDIAARQGGGMGWYFDSGFPVLAVGDEIWMRLSMWIPPDANLCGNSGSGLKFFRFRQKNAAGTAVGYQDLYYSTDTSGNFLKWHMINEANTSPVAWTVLTTDQNAQIIKGGWTTVELYYKLDSVLVSAGGQARARLWINGAPFADNVSGPTLASASHTFFQHLFLTYWNQRSTNPASGAGPDVPYTFYYDQWSCAIKSATRDDTEHLALDVNGHRHIGTAML